MNESKNAVIGEGEVEDDSVDLDELEQQLEAGLEESLSGLDFLEEEKSKISNPDKLGEAVAEVVWDQFINQVGLVAGEDFVTENRGLNLDLRKEAHIQTTENFAEGKIALHNTEIDYQQRYDDWQSNFQRDADGNIITHVTRTGREEATLAEGARKPFDDGRPTGSKEKHTDMDHTVSAGEIIRDAEANAHLTKEEQIRFANSEKNLNEIYAAWNRSKSDLTMQEWLYTPNANGQTPREIFDITPNDEKALLQKEAEARPEFNRQKKEGEQRSIEAGKKSQKAEAFRIGGKALRAAVMGLLAELLRNIIGKLVSWLKQKQKSLDSLIEQIKDAIKTFVGNIKQNLLTAGTAAASTIFTAIIGPVVGTIQKVWALLKQGGKSLKEAIAYVKAPENRKKPVGVLMLEVGKIITAGLTAAGALVLGDVIEKGLMAIPAFAVEIPLLGSLANIIGVFLGAVVAGIAGAIVLNLIDRLVSKKKGQEITDCQIDKGNEVLRGQAQVIAVNQERLRRTKEEVSDTIKERHTEAAKLMMQSIDIILSERKSDNSKVLSDINAALDSLE